MKTDLFTWMASLVLWCAAATGATVAATTTEVSIAADQWRINGEVTYPGAKAEGLLMNVRMVNSVFEDANVMTPRRISMLTPTRTNSSGEFPTT